MPGRQMQQRVVDGTENAMRGGDADRRHDHNKREQVLHAPATIKCGPMRRTLPFLLALTATLTFAQSSNPPLLGFSAASAEKERAVEQQFDAQLHRDNQIGRASC